MADEAFPDNICPYPNYESSGHFAGDMLITENFEKKMYHAFPSEMETQKIRLKHSLEAWKELILPLNSVLQWEKQWHPLSIIGTSTIFFTLLWLVDPSIITTLSLIGLTVTLSDPIVPYLSHNLLKYEPWTEKNEDKFDSICRTTILTKEKIIISFRSFYLMRSTKPVVFYGFNITFLLVLAWIGNNINNLFLTYLAITTVLLLPGLERNGILKRYRCIFIDKIAEFLTNSRVNLDDIKKAN